MKLPSLANFNFELQVFSENYALLIVSISLHRLLLDCVFLYSLVQGGGYWVYMKRGMGACGGATSSFMMTM
jgi:hypothetical protein